MGLRPGPISSHQEIAERLHRLDLDIHRQNQIIRELERDGHPAVGAKTLLRLLEEARRTLTDQMEAQS